MELKLKSYIIYFFIFWQSCLANANQCSSVFTNYNTIHQQQEINQIVDVLVDYYFDAIYEKPESNHPSFRNQPDTDRLNQSEHFKLLATLNIIRKKYGEQAIRLFYQKVDERIFKNSN